MRRKLGDIATDVTDNYQVCYNLCSWGCGGSSISFPSFFLYVSHFSLPSQACIEAVEALSAGQYVTVEKLVLLGELPDDTHGQFYSLLRSNLLPMKDNLVVDLLTLQESQQEASLQQLFERAEAEDSAEVCDSSNVKK